MKNISHKNYEKTMIKIDNLKKKFILIQNYSGFGNKIFDCIIGLYFKINFNYEIYYVDTFGPHKKTGDNSMIEIFPHISKYFLIINDSQGDYIKYILNYKKIYFDINLLGELNKYTNIQKFELIPSLLYKFVYEMFDGFDKKTKEIFIIDEKLIKPDIVSYSNTNYATMHIRYGDKLNYALKKKNGNKFMNFPIYSPKYYYEQIKIINKIKLPIVILTDSLKIVKHFLLKHYKIDNDPNIFVLELSFLESFYLMLKTNYAVLSHSTFSYSAYLLSKYNYKGKNPTYTFCVIDEYNTIYKPYDLFISNEWILYKNYNYILNFNQKLLSQMLEYNENNKKIKNNDKK